MAPAPGGNSRLDWIFHLPLYLAYGEVWLARGRLEPARQAARRLCEFARKPGQRGYLALGQRLLAEIASAEHANDQAYALAASARETLENVEAPLAEWRVLATSARIAAQVSEPELAAAYRLRAAAAVERVAASMNDDEPLRRSLLNAPEVLTLLPPATRSAISGVSGSALRGFTDF
jgi:hypothetical protein